MKLTEWISPTSKFILTVFINNRPVGSGKTALTLALCKRLRDEYNIGSSEKNKIHLFYSLLTQLWKKKKQPLQRTTYSRNTFPFPLHLTSPLSLSHSHRKEDAEFLIRNEALPAERITAIETGGCPHAAIREDISANMGALELLQAKFDCQLLFVESGGDNLAANYSRELADYIIYVIDVSVRVFEVITVQSFFFMSRFFLVRFRVVIKFREKEDRGFLSRIY